MTAKTLTHLVIFSVVLGAIFLLTEPDFKTREQNNSNALFASIQAEKISDVRIKRGSDELSLSHRDGKWTLPSKDGYTADGAKIRSLLLKLLDLRVSQKVSENEKKHTHLGVSSESIGNGQTLVEFLNKKGEELGGIYLGEFRKGKGTTNFSASSGQYVRKNGQKSVYLIAEPITTNASASYWLDTNLVNVLSSNIAGIQQSFRKEGKESEAFELKAKSEAGKFELQGHPEKSDTLDPNALQKASSGIENLKLQNVTKESSEDLKDVDFDAKTVFEMKNGLVYQVETAKTGKTKDQVKFYAKLNVNFDKALADRMQAQAKKTAANEKKEGEKKESPSKPSPQIQTSNAKEAAKINEKYKHWVFTLAQYSAEKLRLEKKDLFQKESQE